MTIEEIKGKIPTLSDDQAAAVSDVATSAVTTAKKELTREIYNNLEKDVFETTGQTKPDGEKTYKFLRDMLTKGREALGALEAERKAITDLQSKYDELAQKAEAGSGASERTDQLTKELEKAKARAKRLEEDLTAKATAWEEKFNQQSQEFEQTRFSSFIEQATSSVTFQEGMSDYVKNLAISDATNKIKSLTREWTDDGRLEFRDENGLVLRDKETTKPLTANDLLKQHLAEAGLLAENPVRGGAGSSKETATKATSSSGFSVEGMPDQITATRALEDHLIAAGHQIGSEEFQQEFNKISGEVIAPADLPVRATAV